MLYKPDPAVQVRTKPAFREVMANTKLSKVTLVQDISYSPKDRMNVRKPDQ